MAGRLAVNIADRNPETGAVEVFAAGSVPPAWAAERVTNPDVWAAGPGVGVSRVDEEVPKPDATAEEPPRSGKGSGVEAWRSYAAGLGIDTAGMSRDDIIEAVEALA